MVCSMRGRHKRGSARPARTSRTAAATRKLHKRLHTHRTFDAEQVGLRSILAGPRTVSPYAARLRFARRWSVHGGLEKGGYPLLSIFILSRTGGLAASPGSCRIIAGRGQNLRKWEERNACVVVASGSRGDAEPMVGLAVQSRALGAAAKGCD